LYDETAAPVHLSEIAPAWEPLLADDDRRSDPQMIGGQNYGYCRKTGISDIKAR
jgi:hypothetical protein